MKIKECMCPDVCFVKPDCKVYDAARIMNENHIGCIPVCNDKKNVVGVLTDRDIVLRTIACDKDVKSTPVSEVMTTKVCTCLSDENIEQAQNTMAKYQVRRLPVLDMQNKMVGILSLGDLAHNAGEIGNENVSETVENICNCKGNIKNYC